MLTGASGYNALRFDTVVGAMGLLHCGVNLALLAAILFGWIRVPR